MTFGRLGKTMVALAAFGCALAVGQAAHATIVERVVAVIGERPILLTDLRKRARPYLMQIIATSRTPAQQAVQESDMYRELLNRMIDERLEEQAADKARLTVTAEEIDRGLKGKADSLGLKVADLLAEARRQGLVESEYRDEVRRQLLEGKLIQLRVMNRVRVSDEDARNEYARWVREVGPVVEVRLLAIRLEPTLTTQQLQAEQQKASQIVAQARSGTDFCTLVAQHTENLQTRQSCGSPGPQPISSLLPPIASAITTMKSGDVSDPITFPGEAIVIVQLFKGPHTPPFEQVKPLMQERAMGAVIDRQRKQWLLELRRGIYIDVRL